MSENYLGALDAAIAAALEAATQNAKDLVQRLGAVDVALNQAGWQQQNGILDQRIQDFAGNVLQNPVVLTRLNFVSSLVPSGQSPFWRAAMEACMQHAGALKPEQLLPVLEACRRGGIYDLMNCSADMLRRKIEGNEPAAWRQRSRVTYELHMACFQRAQQADGAHARKLLEESIFLAEQSAKEAEWAGDPCGRLFALMNISGLLLPKLGRWQEALSLSEQVGAEAERLAASMTDDEARNRPLRVAMNTYLHRLEMLIAHNGRSDDIRSLLGKLEANPVYQACKEHPDVRAAFEAARSYIG